MRTRSLLLVAALLGACATQPDDVPAPATPGPAAMQAGGSEQLLEKKFQEAARDYRLVEKDGRTLYCKKEKVIGSTIPTVQCLSEAQLRMQVENMEELRERMRLNSKCTMGRTGSGGGACTGR